MNKDRKIFKLSLILFLIIVTYNTIVLNFSYGNNVGMNKKIDLIAEYSLTDVDKIIFETTEFARPHQHKVIEDEKTIEFMVNELNNITSVAGKIGEYCNYKVTFWKGKQELLVLYLQIDIYYPDYSFIKYVSKSFKDGFLYDYYYISRAYHDFFVSFIEFEKVSEEELKAMCDLPK